MILAIVGFLQLSLCVRDLDRSRRFYGEALGCEVEAARSFATAAADPQLDATTERATSPTVDSGKGGRAVLVSRDGLRIELFEFDAARPVSPSDAGPAPLHLVFAVDDLEATLHSLRDRGIEVLDETRIRFAPGVVSCFVRDPDGLPIQLYQAPLPATDP
jgi:catechol 2,3-dioxygenase-like lactoylglutathione lyase family enzyme